MQLKYFIPIILLIITIAFSGFTQEENFQTGESHFGVHLGSAWNAPYSLHNEISELGDIYVRLDISSDAYGWKQSKAGQQQVLCQYAFSNKNPVYILWCDAGTCSLPQEISGTVTVTDYLGQEETKQASEISLTDNPIFVE